MKKIVFSIFNDNVDQNHKSTNDFKLNQFRKYKNHLETAQRNYAEKCGADYVLHEVETTDYNSLQFEKIKYLEQYAETYDVILYLDFDVIPLEKAPSIFDIIDPATIAIHPLYRGMTPDQLRRFIKYDGFDNQNVFCKTCAKNSMMVLSNSIGADKLYNTGVVYGGAEVIKSLRFTERLQEFHDLLDEAREDSLYPEVITKNFYYNNEVYMTYIIESENIPHTDLGIQWNFILDGYQPDPVDSAYFLHHVNKEFEKSFGEIC